MGTRRFHLATIVAAVLLLAACDGGPAQDAATTPPATVTQEATGTADATVVQKATTATGTTGTEATSTLPVTPGDTRTIAVDGRQVRLTVPATYDAEIPTPLVILLHGYGSSGARVDDAWPLRSAAAEHGAIFALPEGTKASDDRRFWNAGDACCNFDGSDVDDSAFLADVIGEIAHRYAVDTEHVALVGYSNGGFMAHRAACEHADLVSHVVSVAGSAPDPADCRPVHAVSVLQVHGTDDVVIPYDGGDFGLAEFGSAPESVALWAGHDDCGTGPTVRDDRLDLDAAVDGAETTTTSYGACDDGVRVELWTLDGSGHAPSLGAEFAAGVLDFVTAPAG